MRDPIYRPDTCAYCGTETWCEYRRNGRPQCRACKIERFFEHVLYVPLGYKLTWGRDVLRHIYGTVEPETGERQYLRAYISMAKKNGKALALDTPLPTPSGWTTMGHVQTGDWLFDAHGDPCRVLAVTGVMTGRQCYRITFSDRSSIIADADHLWRTECWKSGRQPWKRRTEADYIHTTEEIRRTLRTGWRCRAANHRIAVAGPLNLPDAELPIPPYTLGCWLGDGTATSATITIGYGDLQIVREIEDEGIPVYEHASSNANSGSFHLGEGNSSQAARNDSPQARLRVLGVLGNKHIPLSYLRASEDQRWALLQGLMDTDGHISKVGQCEFTTTNTNLCAGAQELLCSLGMKPTMKTGRAMLNGRDCGPKFRIQFWAYADRPVFRLNRKIERLKPRPKCPTRASRRQIIAVDSVPSVPVRCVQVDSPSHLYLAGRMMVPTHNSCWAAGLPLYHLVAEDEPRAEAYGVAAAKDQAAVIFRHACEFVKENPVLRDKLRVLPSTKRILRRDGSGFYAVLSADGDLQDGVEPSLNIFDELHRWKTEKAHTLYDVLTKGTISRKEPLSVEVTTSGEEHGSKIWRQEHDLAQKVLSGALPVERFYARIWAADQKRLETDPEYWKSREARLAANPSHGDHGGFLRDAKIAEELSKALRNPGDRPKYLRYHLNLMVSSVEERAIDMDRWQKCGGGVDLRTWPVYDVEHLIRTWGLIERPCWAGVDASWTTDLTALSLMFPPFEAVEDWTLLLFYWMPKELIPELERKTHAPFADWAARGFIEATPGNIIDLRAVKDKIAWAAEMFELREIPFDPWNFRTTALDLIDKGFNCAEIPQNFSHLSAPTKKLVELYIGGKFRHGNNPVLNWNAGCLAFQYDRKDNVQPAKPERGKSTNRIDGISATVTGLARAMAQTPDVRPMIAVF